MSASLHSSAPKPSKSAPSGRLVSAAQGNGLIKAFAFANEIGSPLNRHITISWWRAGLPGRVQDAQREVLQLATKWLLYHGVKTPAFAWVIENGPRLGYHSHIAIHVPDDLSFKFRHMLNRWVKKVGADPHEKGAIRMTRDKYGRDNYHQSVRYLIRYMLKGMEPTAAAFFGVTPNYEKAGLVVGKRVGFSQSIGPAAQRERGSIY